MRRVLLVTLLSATLGLGPLASSPTSAVAVDQRFAVPADGTVTLAGHGYGHGHGMSQYGAEGAARQGKSWQQIVGFYYPGAELGTFRGKVRVLITADTTRDLVLSPRSRLRVVQSADWQGWALPDNGATRWRLVVRRGLSSVQYLTDRWRLFRYLEGDGLFSAGGGRVLELHTPSGPRRYRGILMAARPSADSTDRDTVNVLPMQHYLKGVVPREMPASWSPAAVRAQSVAARTYGAYERRHRRAPHYHFCDTTSCQVYGGYDAEQPASNRAVVDTSGSILRHDRLPAMTQFHSSSGGWTSAGGQPYLPGQADPYDGWDGNANHDWRVRLDVRRFEAAWPALGSLREIRFVERDGNGQWHGRVEEMVLVGSNNTVRVSGTDARWKLGLKSTWFTVARVDAA